MVSTVLSFPACLTIKHLITKVSQIQNSVSSILRILFLAISELALFQTNNYMGLVTLLSSGYSKDLINRNNSFLWFIEIEPFEWQMRFL